MPPRKENKDFWTPGFLNQRGEEEEGEKKGEKEERGKRRRGRETGREKTRGRSKGRRGEKKENCRHEFRMCLLAFLLRAVP